MAVDGSFKTENGWPFERKRSRVESGDRQAKCRMTQDTACGLGEREGGCYR